MLGQIFDFPNPFDGSGGDFTFNPGGSGDFTSPSSGLPITDFNIPGSSGGVDVNLWSILQQGVNYGEHELVSYFNRQFRGSGSDHIPAQNATGAFLTQIMNQLQAGQIIGSEAIRQIQQAIQGFASYARQPQFGSRGQRGAQDLINLGQQLIQSIAATNHVPAPVGGVTGPIAPASPLPGTVAALVSNPTMLLLGGLILAGVLLKGRR